MRKTDKDNYVNTNQDASEKLYDAITNMDDKLIEDAETFEFSKSELLRKNKNSGGKRSFRKSIKILIASAASICLILGIGFAFIWRPAGGSASGDTGTSYMSYMGPVFPLTSTSDTTGIEVSRHTDWDFSPYKSEIITVKMHSDIPENTETYSYDKSENKSIITDQYILTNTTDEDITLSLLYPFAARFSDSIRTVPQITVDGATVESSFLSGKYSGSYSPAWGDEDSEEKLNLNDISTWEGYKVLLADGIYLSDAMKEFPSLDIPIIVYEYSNLTYIGEESAGNPTFAIHFKFDSSKTTITGWGWNAGGWEADDSGYYGGGGGSGGQAENFSGYYGCSRVYIPGGNDIDKGATAYFIVIGEDIETPVVQGYKNGGCDEGTEVNGITADFHKYETTLETFLREVCLAEYSENTEFMVGTDYYDDSYIQSLLTQEMALGFIAQLMYDEGILADDAIERYESGWLEDYVYDFGQMSRVMYLTFEVTIPAGNSVTVNASMIKDASIDYIGKAAYYRNGYDMVTTLASPFTFTKQTASISNGEFIEILDQNFGFDLENGITEVELDLEEEHYWMDIRKKTTEE